MYSKIIFLVIIAAIIGSSGSIFVSMNENIEKLEDILDKKNTLLEETRRVLDEVNQSRLNQIKKVDILENELAIKNLQYEWLSEISNFLIQK